MGKGKGVVEKEKRRNGQLMTESLNKEASRPARAAPENAIWTIVTTPSKKQDEWK